MKENLRRCLDQMDDEFNTIQFTKCLQQDNSLVKITPKYASKSLKSFERKNLITKIGKATYRKLLSTKVDPLDITNDFIRKCRKEGKILFWEYGGFFSTSVQFIMLGIPQNNPRPEWKEKFLAILLERQAEIYKAVEDLLIYDEKSVSLMSEVSRQVLLELIPYLLGHKAGVDHDGLDAHSLLKEVSRLMEFIPYTDPQDEIHEYLKIFQQSIENHTENLEYPKKIAEKLVMMSIPNDWKLDDSYDKRELVKILTKGFKDKLSNETVMFELVNFWDQEIILDTLSELEYLSKDKISEIKKYYQEFSLGRKVLPYFDDIDYCLKTIDQLDKGKLKLGWYGNAEVTDESNDDDKITRKWMELDEYKKTNDEYLGKDKPEYAIYSHDVKENSKILGRLRNRHMNFYEIKSKSHYRNLLRKRITGLRKIVKGTDMDKAIKAAGFTRSYQLPQDSIYLSEGFEISKGLNDDGLLLDEEQIQSNFLRGIKQGDQFIQEALKERRQRRLDD